MTLIGVNFPFLQLDCGHNMNLETLCEFANALDCSMDELLEMKPRQVHYLAYAKEWLELAQALACEESHS